MRAHIAIFTAILAAAFTAAAQGTAKPLKFGNMDHWVTRNVKESKMLGGQMVQVYEIGPDATVSNDYGVYAVDASPWGTSNVVARVAGLTKCSNAVYPDDHPGHGRCAKLTTEIDNCKALGIVNVDVLVAGSIFLGHMIEPVKSTKNPYSHMEMGMPFTDRPQALAFDYKLEVPQGVQRVYCPGFGKKKDLPGSEKAEVMVLLQRRWEDADGNIYAKRVGTGRERFGHTTPGWITAHKTPILYGDITSLPEYKPFMDLIPKSHSYYARNSHGKLVPVVEVGWDTPDATPTHMVLMFSAASGDAYEGTPGLTFWIDNVMTM